MTDPTIGIVVGVAELPESRREVTVTTGVAGRHKLTLMPGVLGTEDGAEFIRRASDLVGVVWREPRRKGTRVRPSGGATGATGVA